MWESQSGTTTGTLITWADEYVQYDETPTNRTFTMVNLLNTDTAKLIRQLILSSDILNLPSDDSIKGWKQGADGITYIIESSTKNYYTFKTYWTPKAQASLQEAVQVQTFVDNLLSLVNAQATWNSFAKTIPYECFINGGPSVICKVLTRKERKRYVKERKKYCQQSVAKSGTDK